jgi:cell pole-organizing protein PopZ
MAQSNVAREPSMEEILASIRKIIESNEPGAGSSLSGSLPPVYATSDDHDSDIHLTVDDEFDAVDLADIPPVAQDPRFVAANSPGREQDAGGPRSTLSLADVAARVRAASERNSTQLNTGREAQPSREMPLAMAARLAEVRLGSEASQPTAEIAPMAAVSMDFAAQMSDVVVPMRSSEPPEQASETVPAQMRLASTPQIQTPPQYHAAAAPELRSPVQAETPPLPRAEQVAAPLPAYSEPLAAFVPPPEQHDRFLPQLHEEAQKMLVSEATGEQVARSFDELAAALGAERRSLDDIAQDMLRPMLQEWLDDNLPTLVERLVREEIERVARGPRR